MNISSAILDMYKLGPMTLDEYKEFLYSPNGKTQKYRIKLQTNKNGILMQNLRNGKPFMLKCVKDYYSPCSIPLSNVTSCADCIERMGIESSFDCRSCHRKCFERYINRHLNRISVKK